MNVLYAIQYKKESLNNVLNRLLCSINSFENQDCVICISNTSDSCFKSFLDKYSKVKIRYIHKPMYISHYNKSITLNFGFRKMVDTEFFVLNDPDIVVQKDYIQNLKKYKNPCRIITINYNTFETVYSSDYNEQLKHLKDYDPIRRPKEGYGWGIGLCHSQTFNDIQGFDERYVNYGPEDSDLCYRMSTLVNFKKLNNEELRTTHIYHGRSYPVLNPSNQKLWKQTETLVNEINKSNMTKEAKLNLVKRNNIQWGSF